MSLSQKPISGIAAHPAGAVSLTQEYKPWQRYRRKTLTAALALALSSLAQGTVAAEDGQVSFDELDGELKVLLRKLESANEDNEAFKQANPVVVTAGEKGFGLQSLDKNFDIKLRGFIQADARYFDHGISGLHTGKAGDQLEPSDNLLIRRARINIEGTVFGKYGFRITPDFAGSSVTLADAYVDANWLPEFRVRAGKFRPIVEFERLQSSPDYKFNETSLVTNFIPTRDVGLQISGDFAGNTLNYTVAYVNGANDGASGPNADVDTDKEWQARLFYTPFGLFQGLGVGIAATHTNTHGDTGRTALSSYRTSGQEAFFGYRSDRNIAAATNPVTTASLDTVYADGKRDRLIPQVHYFKSNFGAFAEYISEEQVLTREVVDAATPANNLKRTDEVKNDGWALTAAWTVTGEEQSLKGIKPFNNFDVAKGGAGAWELVFRASELSIDEDVFKDAAGVVGGKGSFAESNRAAQKASNLGLGVNWYLNKVIKVAVNYEETRFEGGAGTVKANPEDRDAERVLIGRVQANF